jgi:hypothetical protein
MDELTFETELRAMLDRRDPGPARVGYPEVVLARVRLEPVPGHFDRARRGVSGLAAVAAVVALAVVAAIVLRPGAPGPAASPGPLPSAPPGLVVGDGITSGEFLPVLQIIVWVIALGGSIWLVARSRKRAATVAGTLAVVGLLWVAANIGTSDAIVETGMVGAIDPYSAATEMTDYGVTISVDGDQPFRSILVLRNASTFPLTLRGMAASPSFDGYDPPINPRFVAFGRIPDTEYTFDHVRPFEPVVLEPNALLNVVVLGMTGACTVGADHPSDGSHVLPTITLVYDQLSIIHTEDVRLTRTMNFRSRSPCPPDGSSPAAP